MKQSLGFCNLELTYKYRLIKEIQDWQADLLLDIERIEDLEVKSVRDLQLQVAFYQDTLKNGKRL